MCEENEGGGERMQDGCENSLNRLKILDNSIITGRCTEEWEGRWQKEEEKQDACGDRLRIVMK